jgi:hypothetical protein
MEKNTAVLSVIVVLVLIVALLGIFLYWDELFPPEDERGTQQQIDDNIAPIAKMDVDHTTVHVSDIINFNGNESEDPDGEIDLYIWNFGDGTPPTQSPNASHITHSYTSGGDYTVNFTVQDDDNARNSTYVNIHVIPQNFYEDGAMFVLARENAMPNASADFPVEEEVKTVNVSLTIIGLKLEGGVENAEFEIYVYNSYNVALDSEEITVTGTETVTFDFDENDLKNYGDYNLEVRCNAGGGYITYEIEVRYD